MNTKDEPELKDIAAAELLWAISREETYKNDGAPVPEPIRRLKTLAAAVQETPDTRPGADSYRDSLRAAASRLGIDLAHQMGDVAILNEMEKRAANSAGIRNVVERCHLALTDAAGVLVRMRDELGGLFIAGDGPVLPANAQGNKSESISLSHGLLLKQIKTGHRALFSQVAADKFVYVWVSPDGKQATAPTATSPERWRADEWKMCSETIGISPDEALRVMSAAGIVTGEHAAPATPGPQVRPSDHVEFQPSPAKPEPGAASSNSGLIQDWNPSAEDMTKSANDLAAAMQKAALTAEINVPRLVEKFKAEKGAEASKRPAMAFYHWAIKILKGA